MQFPGRQWEQHGVLPYPPPVTLRCVTRWDLSWQGKTHLVWKAAVKKKKNTYVWWQVSGVSLGFFFFFWEHQKWAYFLWLVLLTSFSRSSASVSLSYPLFSHTPEFPALFWFTDNTQPPVLGYCLYFPLCASVGNSAFPVSHLVGWSSVDFVQTVGSALRGRLSTWFAVAPHSTQFIQETGWQ